MATKVVIENAVLRGSQQEQFWQKVAAVYLDGGEEFNVVAPPKATGDALEWLKQFQVRSPTAHGYNPVTDGRDHSIIQQVQAELEKRKLDSEIYRMGTNPDGNYVAAQICLRGHVLNVSGMDFERGEHCPKCGEIGIDACQHCKVAIRGGQIYASPLEYRLPNFCHKCGRPYPWTEDKLSTAKELLWHDDKLTLEEREKLWGQLQYVMSDPKADSAPAKKKLFEIGIAKALPATREFLLDFMAKLGAEILKP
jgi:hypothetical protein